MIAGARQGRSSTIRGLTAWAMARELRCFIVPGADVALAYGLDVEAAGMRIAATPRDAGVLLLIGELPPSLGEAATVLYAQMPRPRAILALGGQAPSPLPHADVSAELSQAELVAAVDRLREALTEGAFAASPLDFDAPVLRTRVEYVCPMHPEVVEDEPGTCPKCGMDLEAREAGEGTGDGETAPEHDSHHHDHEQEHHHDHEQEHHHGDQEHHDHAGHDHDAMGFMSMVEVTRDLPRSADGLPMDRIEAPFGPCFPGLPGGLRLTLALDGDGVAEGGAESVVGLTLPDDGVDADTFVEHLATSTPLTPASYRLLACRAIERAADLEADPATARARAGGLERERITSHLGWLAQLGRQLGFAWLTRRATSLQLLSRHANRDRLVALRPALQALTARVGRTPLLQSRLEGIAILSRSSLDLRGPVARAAGGSEDARQADAIYRELGFEISTAGAGDAWARLWQRLSEIRASLDLVEAAGEPRFSVLRDISSVIGTGAATVETPRGCAALSLTLDRGRVVSVKLDTASSHHISLVPSLIEGQELGDALVAVGSLDLSPWEVIA